jgi:hypothetical protein
MSPSRYDLARAPLNVFAWTRAREDACDGIVLIEQGEMTVAATRGLWLSAADAERTTRWTLKRKRMCQDDGCVPLSVYDDRGDVVAPSGAGQSAAPGAVERLASGGGPGRGWQGPEA